MLLHHGFNGDGRTDRASLQIVTRQLVTRQLVTRQLVTRQLLLHNGFNGDGRTTVRPYKSLLVRSLHVRSSLDVVWYLSYYYFCVVS